MKDIKRQLPIVQEGDFYQSIQRAKKQGNHDEYLDEILDAYEKYKQVFSQAFTENNPLDAIYVFRVNYLLKVPVWRDIAILGNQTFYHLAKTIIRSMGWKNDHMHGFSIPQVDKIYQSRFADYSIFAPGWKDDPFPTIKTDKVKIADVDYKKHPKWEFIFDFGDGHLFTIELRKIETGNEAKDYCKNFPVCVDQHGIAPEQYPEYKDYSDEENTEDGEWKFDDNCPECQKLKKAGVKLSWYPD